MVLLDHIIQILALPCFDPLASIIIILFYGCSIGATFIDIDQAWLTVVAYSFGEKPQCRLFVSLRGQEKVDSGAISINCPVVVFPLSFNADLGFIKTPAKPRFPFLFSKSTQKLWRVVCNPTVNGAVVNVKSSFLHDFFQITIAQAIGEIPTNTLKDHLTTKMPAFEGNRCYLTISKPRILAPHGICDRTTVPPWGSRDFPAIDCKNGLQKK